MSLTEEARAPFSLVDEINQVCTLRPVTKGFIVFVSL